MPFDTALAEATAPTFNAGPFADGTEAFGGSAPDARTALANPEAALAFLFLSPRPCEALDALLAA